MKNPNILVAERWFEEVWNQGREEAVRELLSEEAVIHNMGPEGGPARGPEGFKPFHRTMRAAFPDVRITVEDAVADGDTVAVRWVATMTHTGDGLGIPPTNRKARVTGMGFCRVANGQIVEGWNNWDEMGLMKQIG